MGRARVIAMSFGMLFLLAGSKASAQPQPRPPILPLEPLRERGQGVTGAFEGWFQNPDGTYTLLVGYFNRNTKETLDIPVGPSNRIEPGGPDYGQPTYFLPRRQWGVFTITVPKDFADKKLTWTLVAYGQTNTISLTLHPAYVVNPFKHVMGNTPPIVKFAPNGPAFQGPPRTVAHTLTAKAGQPLPLTVWVADDMVEQEPAAGFTAEKAPPPIRVFWSKFRGPGEVTFEKERPEVDLKANGKAETTATFSAPGDYLLRVQVNDRSGDGGGGFQCCWTNAHVKVTVLPQ